MPPILDFVRAVSTPDFAALHSSDGRGWIKDLPSLADEVCRAWRLMIDVGQLRHGYHAVVVPVSGDGAKWVLKLAWPPSSIVDESIALRTWHGRGAARLGRADLERGVLLLERLDADHSLNDLPLVDAALQAASLLREMSVPAPAGIRSGREDIEAMIQTMKARRGVIDARQRHWVDAALPLVDSLATGVGATLVHGDLHYENVLRGERRPWLAIDPKPVASDPERGLAELLFTRVDELSNDGAIRDLLAVIIEAGRLRSERAEVWAFVRTVDYWLWAVAHGLTVDPPRCERVLQALQPLLP